MEKVTIGGLDFTLVGQGEDIMTGVLGNKAVNISSKDVAVFPDGNIVDIPEGFTLFKNATNSSPADIELVHVVCFGLQCEEKDDNKGPACDSESSRHVGLIIEWKCQLHDATKKKDFVMLRHHAVCACHRGHRTFFRQDLIVIITLSYPQLRARTETPSHTQNHHNWLDLEASFLASVGFQVAEATATAIKRS